MLSFNNSYLLIFLVIYAIYHVLQGGTRSIQETLFILPGLIIALTLHEYAHAKMADKLGDPTPEAQGRITLNPLAHLDPMGTICLLFAGFGWGKPVQVNPSNFRQPTKDEAKVAAAGPIMNFIIAIVSFAIYLLILVLLIKTKNYTSVTEFDSVRGIFVNNIGFNSKIEIILSIIQLAIFTNISLGLFNLLPFPPLDGSKIFRAILKGKAREFIYTLENYSFIIIAVLYFTSLPAVLISPLFDLIRLGMHNFTNMIINII